MNNEKQIRNSLEQIATAAFSSAIGKTDDLINKTIDQSIELISQAVQEAKREWIENYIYGIQKIQGTLSRYGHEDKSQGEGTTISTVDNTRVLMKQLISELQIELKSTHPSKDEPEKCNCHCHHTAQYIGQPGYGMQPNYAECPLNCEPKCIHCEPEWGK